MRNSIQISQEYLNEMEIALSARVNPEGRRDIRIAEAQRMRGDIVSRLERSKGNIDQYVTDALTNTRSHTRIGAEVVSARACIQICEAFLAVLDTLEARARGAVPGEGVVVNISTGPHEYQHFGPTLATWIEPPPPAPPMENATSLTQDGVAR